MNKEKIRKLVKSLGDYQRQKTFLEILSENSIDMPNGKKGAANELLRRGAVDVYPLSDDEEAISAFNDAIVAGDPVQPVPIIVMQLFGQAFNLFPSAQQSALVAPLCSAAERNPGWKIPVEFAGIVRCNTSGVRIRGVNVTGHGRQWTGVDKEIIEALKKAGVQWRN